MLRVAFLGGSINSAIGRAHFTALSMDGNFKVVSGMFSRAREVNLQTAATYGVKDVSAYNSIDHLISDSKNYDLIALLTPTPQHSQELKLLKKANLHVVSEKSLVHNVEESKIIGELYNENELSVIFNYTGYPMVREMRRRIKDAEIGDIQQIQVEMPQEGFEKHDLSGKPIQPQTWRLVDGEIPTVALDLGVHLDSLIQFLTSEIPLSVFAVSNRYGNFEQIIDTQSALIKYSNGISVNFWISKAALGERNGIKIRIFGSKGSFQWVQERPDRIEFTNQFGVKRTIDRGDPSLKVAGKSRYMRFKPGHPTGFIEALANYYADVSQKLNYLPNFEDEDGYVFSWKEAHQGILLMNAIILSSRQGVQVKL